MVRNTTTIYKSAGRVISEFLAFKSEVDIYKPLTIRELDWSEISFCMNLHTRTVRTLVRSISIITGKVTCYSDSKCWILFYPIGTSFCCPQWLFGQLIR
jgi:hypothetical protein